NSSAVMVRPSWFRTKRQCCADEPATPPVAAAAAVTAAGISDGTVAVAASRVGLPVAIRTPGGSLTASAAATGNDATSLSIELAGAVGVGATAATSFAAGALPA